LENFFSNDRLEWNLLRQGKYSTDFFLKILSFWKKWASLSFQWEKTSTQLIPRYLEASQLG
jgi:hypothetical protein